MDAKVSTKTKTYQNLNKNCPLVSIRIGSILYGVSDEDDLPMRQTRKRVCYDPSNEKAMGCESKGPAQEERICGDAICPKPPSWANWGPWESCSSVCKEEGEGHQLRRRLCLDDRRSGLTCATNPPEGPSVQKQICLAESISCGSNANFGSWEEWGPCDLSCAPRDGKTTGMALPVMEFLDQGHKIRNQHRDLS